MQAARRAAGKGEKALKVRVAAAQPCRTAGCSKLQDPGGFAKGMRLCKGQEAGKPLEEL